jgi:glycosyltransferase involved in cell wall biosynthesis
MKRKVTALVFAYNNAKDIERCLRSISEQTAVDQIHVVVHDDASTDSTVELATSFLSSTSVSWEIVTNETNQFTQGIDFFRRVMMNCKTPFVALCDADDYWLTPDKVERQLAQMERDEEIVLSHHSYEVFLADSMKKIGHLNVSDPNPDGSLTKILGGNYVGACTAMFRLSAANGHPSWNGYGECTVPDYPLWGALGTHGKISWIDNATSAYGVSSSSLSARISPLSLRVASLKVRRWLWFQYSISGKFDSGELGEAWKNLMLDWQVVPGHRLTLISYLRGKFRLGVFKRLSIVQLWNAQFAYSKIRTYRLPRGRK